MLLTNSKENCDFLVVDVLQGKAGKLRFVLFPFGPLDERTVEFEAGGCGGVINGVPAAAGIPEFEVDRSHRLTALAMETLDLGWRRRELEPKLSGVRLGDVGT